MAVRRRPLARSSALRHRLVGLLNGLMNQLLVPLLVLPLALAGLGGQAAELKGNIVVYKVRLTGAGSWGSSLYQPSQWVVLDVVDGRSVVLRQSTLVVDGFTGFSKWWDHPVTASRACVQTSERWAEPGDCVRGRGNLIQLPEGASPFAYTYELRWQEAGRIQSAAVTIQPSDRPSQIRSMR